MKALIRILLKDVHVKLFDEVLLFISQIPLHVYSIHIERHIRLILRE